MKHPKLSVADIPVPSSLSHAPHLIHDENGKITGVILSYTDYQTFLRVLAAHADWEALPPMSARRR